MNGSGNGNQNHEDYAKKLEEVGSRPLDGLTVAEIAGLLREYSRYERLVADADAYARAPHPVRAQSQPSPAPPQPRYGTPVKAAAKKHEKRLNEAVVGRYGMTVAAAVLCLLGVAIFAAGFWHGLPGPAKYGIVLSAGLGLWALGYVKSKGPMRPFWLGVAGLGSGAVFLDFILGHSEWDLYGMLFAGALCLAWTGACFLMGKRAQAWLFYIIAYAGGWITFWMAYGTAMSAGDEVLCGIIAVTILAMGAAAWYFNHRRWLLAAAWMAACWSMGAALADTWHWAPDGFSWTPAAPYFCAAMACGAAWFLPKAVPEMKNHIWAGHLAMAAAALINAYFVECMAGVLFPHGNYSANILAAGILVSGSFIAKPGYLLGFAVPLVSMIAGPPAWAGALAASVLALAACGASAVRNEKIDRLGLFLIWLSAAYAAVGSAGVPPAGSQAFAYIPKHPEAYLAACIILLEGLGLWSYLRYRHRDWAVGRLSWLVVLCAGLYALCIPFNAYGWPEYLMICLAALSFNAFRRFGLSGTDMRSDTVAWIGTCLACAVSTGALTIEALFLGAFGSTVQNGEAAAMTLTLAAMAGLDAYGMVRSRYPMQGALACLAANWCLFISAGIWAPDARSLVSAAGILTSAVFVAAGFCLDKMRARQAGLACALLYAVKLGLYDMSLSGGLGMSAGLFVAGAGCFGISLLYNKLGKALQANAGAAFEKEGHDDGSA